VQQVFEEAVREGKQFEANCRILRPDGDIRYIDSLAEPVFNPAGELIEYVGTIIDNTDRKNTEEARTELLRRLVLAQEEERRRIAREMHDQLGQQLTSLILRLGMLKGNHEKDDDLNAQLRALEADAKQLDRDVDFLIWELHPTVLDDLGLQAALTKHIRNWSRHFGVPAELHVTGMERDRLTPDIETTLYRIAQEALTNVAKHAKATKVDIILERGVEQVSLIVEDNGSGFDTNMPVQVGDGGFGLIGMAERGAVVEGTVGIESSPGIGTTIFVRIPAPRVANGER
jgi:signal transduction histidine kinase